MGYIGYIQDLEFTLKRPSNPDSGRFHFGQTRPEFGSDGIHLAVKRPGLYMGSFLAAENSDFTV